MYQTERGGVLDAEEAAKNWRRATRRVARMAIGMARLSRLK
jgi:hypothetical protein